MIRKMLLCLVPVTFLVSFELPAQSSIQQARGVVFHDLDGNGRRDGGEAGIAGVAVSNGREVLLTDSEGRYTLEVGEDTALFVIKPQGWRVPVQPGTNLPQHYYLHKPAGSPKLHYSGVPPTGKLPASVDFPLSPQEEPDQFRMICFGDTQPRDRREVEYIAHDLVEELAGFDAAFGVTLGDLVNHDLSLQESVARNVGLIGVPWYHVIGNHDENLDAPTLDQTDESYERVFGPSYYAFNHGPVHFVVLDDIVMEIPSNRYHAELGERQRAFLQNDLNLVPKDRLVVLMMHIPLPLLKDQAELFEILKDRPYTFSLSAHTHTNYHMFLSVGSGKETGLHHHLVHGTACGGWWTGRPDESGIPHATMGDGTPNGYSIISFDKNRYSVVWKAARRPADYQMNLYAPETAKASEAGDTAVVVNVFAGSERSEVKMRLGEEGSWVPMERFKGHDPGLLRMRNEAFSLAKRIAGERGPEILAALDNRGRDAILNEYRDLVGRLITGPAECRHLWRAKLPAGAPPGCHLIHVRETDLFGKTHAGCRVIRIEAD